METKRNRQLSHSREKELRLKRGGPLMLLKKRNRFKRRGKIKTGAGIAYGEKDLLKRGDSPHLEIKDPSRHQTPKGLLSSCIPRLNLGTGSWGSEPNN